MSGVGVTANILTRETPWPARFGVFIVAGMMCVLVALSWSIRWPTTIQLPVVLHSTRAALRVAAGQDAVIGSLHVGDGAAVAAGTPLATMADDAASRAAAALESMLERRPRFDVVPAATLPELMRVADIDQVYITFKKLNDALVASQRLASDGSSSIRQRESAQARRLDRLYRDLTEELARPVTEGEASRPRHNDDGFLRLLAEERLREQLRIAELIQGLPEQGRSRELADWDLRADLEDWAARLATELRKWEDCRVIRAPCAGRVRFLRHLRAGDTVGKSEFLFEMLQPEVRPYAEGVVTASNSRQLRVGQEARIKLYGVAGIIKATVSEVSPKPGGAWYAARLDLGNSALGGSQQRPGAIRGRAEVVTDGRRILRKFMNERHGSN